MNRPWPAPPVLLAALLTVTLPLLCAPATAASRVNRCLDANGNAVYTDRACEQVGAQPVTQLQDDPSAEAQARSIKLEEALDCAQNLSDFSDRLSRALAADDVNALAALHDWVNTGRYAARRVFADFQALLMTPGQPWVVRIESTPEGAPVAASILSDSPLSDSQAAPIRSYPLLRHTGCWWLTSALPTSD